MSHSEPRRPFVPPFLPPTRTDDIDDLLEAGEAAGEPVFRREGLPPGYRMRHDSHYVDQLTSRAGVTHVRAIPVRDIDAAPPASLAGLEPLTRSIAQHGVLQPLLVRSRGARFELIAGARRLAAAASAGLAEVPCLVHACDEAKARLIAEADNLRAAETTAPAAPRTPASAPEAPHSPAGALVPRAGLRELQQSVSTIDSCLHLLAEGTSLRDRVAIDLIRTEAHRTERLVRALAVLAETPGVTSGAGSLREAVERSLEALAPERRLSGVHLNVDTGNPAWQVRADQDLLATGVSCLIGAMLALVQAARLPALWITVTASPSEGVLVLEISQQVVTLPPASLDRFFDADWTDRPGGCQAAVALAAVRRIADLHGGRAEVVPGETGGCRVRLALTAAQ